MGITAQFADQVQVDIAYGVDPLFTGEGRHRRTDRFRRVKGRAGPDEYAPHTDRSTSRRWALGRSNAFDARIDSAPGYG